MSDQSQKLNDNYIKSINPYEDVETKTWLLKNYDPMVIITKIKEIESSTTSTAFKKLFKTLYQEVVDGTLASKIKSSSSDADVSVLSEEELQLLGYVLRYKKGFYEQNETIVDINDPDSEGTFNLLDPGFYLIEVSGSGCDTGTDWDAKSGINSNEPFYKNLLTTCPEWKSEDGKVVLDFGSHMSWRIQIKDEIGTVTSDFGGKFEMNDTNVFLFKSTFAKDEVLTLDDLVDIWKANIDPEVQEQDRKAYFLDEDCTTVLDIYQFTDADKDLDSLKDYLGKIKDNTVLYSDKTDTSVTKNVFLSSYDKNSTMQCYPYLRYSTADFWDSFSLQNFDLLADVKVFFRVILSVNNYRLMLWDDNGISDLYDTIQICTKMHHMSDTYSNGKTVKGVATNVPLGFYYNSILRAIDASGRNYNISNYSLKYNAFNGGFPNYLSCVETKNGGAYGLDGGHIYLIVNLNKNDVGTFSYSLKGQSVRIDKSEVLSIVANNGGMQNTSTNNASQTNLKDQLRFKIGEKSIYDADKETSLNKPGACSVIWHGNNIGSTVYGGGGKGSGVKRNIYDNLYWQDAEKGYIKITYLGDESLERKNYSFAAESHADIQVDGQTYYGDSARWTSENSDAYVQSHVFFAGYDDDGSSPTISSKSGKFPVGTYIPIEFMSLPESNSWIGNCTIENDAGGDELEGSKNFNQVGSRFGNVFTDEILSADNDVKLTAKYSRYGAFFDYDESERYTIKSFNDDYLLEAKEFYVDVAYEDQNIDINMDVLSRYNGRFTNDEDYYDAIGKKTSIVISNDIEDNSIPKQRNIYIVGTVQDVYQLSMSYANTLDLPQITDYFNTALTIMKYKEGVKIDHCEVYFDFNKIDASENDSKKSYYIEGKKLKVAGGQYVVIKVWFTSPRVRVNETLTNFPISAVYNDLCKDITYNDLDRQVFDPRDLDQSGKNEPWKNYKNLAGIDNSFEYIEFYMPSYSLNVDVYIEKNTHSVTILDDLYIRTTQRILSDKTEFEFYEPVPIGIELSKNIRVSNLYTPYGVYEKNNTDSNNERCYIIKPKNNLKYESFFSFNKSYDNLDVDNEDKVKIFQDEIVPIYNDGTINNNFNKIFISDTFWLKSSRLDISGQTSDNSLLGLSAVYQPQYASKFSDETAVYVFSMNNCSMTMRATSAYLPFTNLCIIENGQSIALSLFKPVSLVMAMSAGATGNGGNGSKYGNNVKEHTLIMPLFDLIPGNIGGFGGDGFIGGTGGEGSTGTGIDAGVDDWHGVAITGFGLYYIGGAIGGLGGRGFLTSSGGGSPGAGSFGISGYASLYGYEDVVTDSIIKNRTFLYTGCAFIGYFSINVKNTDTTIYSGPNITIKTGIKGSDGTDGYGNETRNGGGGGPGTPSYLRILNSDLFVINELYNMMPCHIYSDSPNAKNYIFSNTNEYSNIFLGPGIRGQAYALQREESLILRIKLVWISITSGLSLADKGYFPNTYGINLNYNSSETRNAFESPYYSTGNKISARNYILNYNNDKNHTIWLNPEIKSSSKNNFDKTAFHPDYSIANYSFKLKNGMGENGPRYEAISGYDWSNDEKLFFPKENSNAFNKENFDCSYSLFNDDDLWGIPSYSMENDTNNSRLQEYINMNISGYNSNMIESGVCQLYIYSECLSLPADSQISKNRIVSSINLNENLIIENENITPIGNWPIINNRQDLNTYKKIFSEWK